MKRKLLALVLALCMVFSLVPMGAFATDEPAESAMVEPFKAMSAERYNASWKKLSNVPDSVDAFGTGINLAVGPITDGNDGKKVCTVTVTGELNYITGFTAFNTAVTGEQEGYYLPFMFTIPKKSDTVTDVSESGKVFWTAKKEFNTESFSNGEVEFIQHFAAPEGENAKFANFTITADWDGAVSNVEDETRATPDGSKYAETVYTFDMSAVTFKAKNADVKVESLGFKADAKKAQAAAQALKPADSAEIPENDSDINTMYFKVTGLDKNQTYQVHISGPTPSPDVDEALPSTMPNHAADDWTKVSYGQDKTQNIMGDDGSVVLRYSLRPESSSDHADDPEGNMLDEGKYTVDVYAAETNSPAPTADAKITGATSVMDLVRVTVDYNGGTSAVVNEEFVKTSKFYTEVKGDDEATTGIKFYANMADLPNANSSWTPAQLANLVTFDPQPALNGQNVVTWNYNATTKTFTADYTVPEPPVTLPTTNPDPTEEPTPTPSTEPSPSPSTEPTTDPTTSPTTDPTTSPTTNPTPTPDPVVEVTPDVKVDEETGAVSAEVPAEKHDEIIEAAKNEDNATVTVKVDAPADSDKPVNEATVSLPAQTVEQLGNDTTASLKVETPVASVTVSQNDLAALGSGAESVTVSVKKDAEAGTVQVEVKKDDAVVEDIALKAEVPSIDDSKLTPTTVAVIVDANGKETIVPKSVVNSDNSAITVLLKSGNATIKFKENKKEFTDEIPSWAQSHVDFVTSRGLYGGTSEGVFNPNATMNRAMLVQVLYALESRPETDTNDLFGDVQEGQWYTKAVAWGKATGIVAGVSPTEFGPNNKVTREQLALILYNFAKKSGMDISKSASTDSFNDAGQVHSWADKALQWAVGNNIIGGKNGNKLDPRGDAKRAEVAVMITNFVKLMTK